MVRSGVAHAYSDIFSQFINDVVMLLHEKLKDKTLILGSRSPRRKELLAGCGLRFVTAVDYDVEEKYPDGMPASEVPEYLARLKSDAYPQPLTDSEILVTADTVVIVDGRILGKPADRSDAIAMIQSLSGRRHTVVTGVAIRDNCRADSFSVSSDVWMRALRHEEVEYYVDTYKPYDKAGAYGIQEWIGYVAVERIEGSFYNVMGLPVQALYVRLERFLDICELPSRAALNISDNVD